MPASGEMGLPRLRWRSATSVSLEVGRVGLQLPVAGEDRLHGGDAGRDLQVHRCTTGRFKDDLQGLRPLFGRRTEDAWIALPDDAALGGKAIDYWRQLARQMGRGGV